MFQYVIAGLVFGSIYALSASGLVVTYLSAGILNFSFGATAFAVARLYYSLNTEHGWSAFPAFVVSVFVAAPLIGILLYVLLFRHLQLSSTLIKIVATIGVAVALPPIVTLVFGNQPILLAPGVAPRPLDVFDVFGVAVNMDQIVVYACVLIVMALGVVVIRYTDIGLRVRAMVDSPALTAVSGTNPKFIAAGVWAASTFLAGLVGVVSAPIVGLDANSFLLLMIAAFACVIAARLHSIPVAVAVGFAIGITGSVVQYYLPTSSSLTQAVIPSIPFVFTAIFLVYNVVRRGSVDEGRRVGGTLDHAIAPLGLVRTGGGAASRSSTRATSALAVGVVVIVAVLAQVLSSFWVTQLAVGVVFGVVFLAFTLVIGEGGMIWLCIATFAGAGGITAAQLATVHGWPLGLAVIGGGLVAMLLGVLIGLLSIRLGTLYIALVTLTFGLLMENLAFTRPDFANFGSGVNLARPEFANGDVEFTYLALAVFCIIALVVVNLRRSTTGLALGAVRSSGDASRTMGISVLQMKLLVGGLAAFVAGIGGALLAIQRGGARPTDFATILGLVWLAVLVSTGVRSTIAALIAGITFTILPAVMEVYMPTSWAQIPPILFGFGAIVLARYPEGSLAMNARQLQSIVAARPPTPRTGAGGAGGSRRPDPPMTAPVLSATALAVHFGGITALDDVTLEAALGACTGLVGPNGAGKSTAFAVLSGLLKPDAGRVWLAGTDVTRASAQARARRGLARTFQQPELFPWLTVREHFVLGDRLRHARRRLWLDVVTAGSIRPESPAEAERVGRLVDLLSLGGREHEPVDTLPLGTSRLVEIGRALATDPAVVLLDEPFSGLAGREVDRLVAAFEHVVGTGVALLLVEHDVPLVLDLCSRVFVLDFGRVIADGTPADIRASTAVRDAYLGDTDVESGRSSRKARR